jgi:hypothetical protein
VEVITIINLLKLLVLGVFIVSISLISGTYSIYAQDDCQGASQCVDDCKTTCYENTENPCKRGLADTYGQCISNYKQQQICCFDECLSTNCNLGTDNPLPICVQ